MKKIFFTCIAALILCSFSLYAPFEIEIDISPNVLNIGSSGTVVSVHTNIAFSAVDGASCYLNGVALDWSKSDNRGQFVAKFDILSSGRHENLNRIFSGNPVVGPGGDFHP